METKESRNVAKKVAAEMALNFVKDGMMIGLGTGSTATFFIQELGKRVLQGLKIHAIASSESSEKLARSLNIPLASHDTVTSLDLTVDGADEIDPQKNMIKGGGGALFREKIVASMSQEVIIVVDDHKYVNTLGNFPLAIEILPFAWQATAHHLSKINLQGHLRMMKDNHPFVTDNGNYIYDIAKESLQQDLQKLNALLHIIPGVIETGLFFGLATKILVGYDDGSVEIFE